MKEIVNFAIIGLGSISTTHIAALKEIDEANLVAVYDRTIEKAKKSSSYGKCQGV
ncbi:hypothetical protein TSYNTROPHJE_15790 [Tepidanaerobacter syntrophicus]|uniref:Gfo/Idh/MocA family oxidoreductase n=1 Tax=Tepidanaerobacter syntrophicus TaxID=224999 RepID=UPI0022ED8EFF|nr:Gfo/Idh/MocA family oxidoreductase [Tepidanaerobacter syntrophicus]GLI19766.1 hypothetical protein TSYNTROPHJE_15790 [Tepidanaerobacter syntrophicus]